MRTVSTSIDVDPEQLYEELTDAGQHQAVTEANRGERRSTKL